MTRLEIFTDAEDEEIFLTKDNFKFCPLCGRRLEYSSHKECSWCQVYFYIQEVK